MFEESWRLKQCFFAALLILGSALLIFFSFAVISPPEKKYIDISSLLGIDSAEKSDLIAAGDFDDDGMCEYIATIKFPDDRSFICFLSNEELLWEKEVKNISGIKVIDIDGDDRKDSILAIITDEGITNILALDLFGVDLFTLPLDSKIGGLTLSDFNNDGSKEICVTEEEGKLYVYDFYDLSEIHKIDLKLDLENGEKNISLANYDINGDGTNEIIGLTNIGKIYIVYTTGEITTKDISNYTDPSSAGPLISPVDKAIDVLFYKNIIISYLGRNIIGCKGNGQPAFAGEYSMAIDENSAGIISSVAVGIINDVPIIAAATTDGWGYVFDLEKGQLLSGWPKNICSPIPIYSRPILKSIIFTSADRHITDYDLDGNKLNEWKIEATGTVTSTPIIVENLLILASNDGMLNFVDMGEVKEEEWDEEFEEGYEAENEGELEEEEPEFFDEEWEWGYENDEPEYEEDEGEWEEEGAEEEIEGEEEQEEEPEEEEEEAEEDEDEEEDEEKDEEEQEGEEQETDEEETEPDEKDEEEQKDEEVGEEEEETTEEETEEEEIEESYPMPAEKPVIASHIESKTKIAQKTTTESKTPGEKDIIPVETEIGPEKELIENIRLQINKFIQRVRLFLERRQ